MLDSKWTVNFRFTNPEFEFAWLYEQIDGYMNELKLPDSHIKLNMGGEFGFTKEFPTNFHRISVECSFQSRDQLNLLEQAQGERMAHMSIKKRLSIIRLIIVDENNVIQN